MMNQNFISWKCGVMVKDLIPQHGDEHYNKKCPCTLSDFNRFWVNSLV
jgi:hypothetical protein